MISLVAVLAGLLAAEAGADTQAPAQAPPLIQPPAPQRVGEPQRIELKDAKDGTGDLLYETSGFTARIAPDGSVAFFVAAGHLYRFLAASKTTTDLTPGGGVLGVLGASDDGTYAYYQDAGGLRQWHSGATATIAPVI